MEIVRIIWFELYEKIKLRHWQGVGRATNFSSSKRNDKFYLKLEKNLLPILVDMEFEKRRKRRFTKDLGKKLFFIEFGLTNKLNGIKVSYGSLEKTKELSEERLSGFHSLSSYGQHGKDVFYLRPPFWNYDYEYPVRKNEKNDQLIISEIIDLLNPIFIDNGFKTTANNV